MEPRIPDLTLDFLRLVWAVNHGLQAGSKRLLARAGVTTPQRLAIRLIGANPGIAAGELAGLLHEHPSTLTGVLQRLETNGFVQRQSHAEDRRRAVLTLTEAGQRIEGMRVGTVESAVARAMSRAGPEALDGARRVLEELAKALSEEFPPE